MAGPGLRRATAPLLQHVPQQDPADDSRHLVAQQASGSVLHRTWTRVTVLRCRQGRRRAVPGLGTTVSPALRVLAQAQMPQASDRAKQVVVSVPTTDNRRLSACFKPRHQEPWWRLPSCTGCPALGLPWALAPRSLQPPAPERWGLARGALGEGRVLNGKTVVTDYFF